NYDNLYRLTGESWTGPLGQGHSYTYDPAGNRLSHVATLDTYPTTTRSVYDDRNRQISSTATRSYTPTVTNTFSYDANGNRSEKDVNVAGVSDVATIYTYDVSNRLKSATVDGVQVFSALYDARTRRVAKTETGTTTEFRYDGGTNSQELPAGHVPTE